MSISQRLRSISPRISWLLAVLLLLVTFSTGFAIRPFIQEETATYFTGCLDPTKGVLYFVDMGTNPLKACKTGHAQVTWSDGDILDVTAGTGLIGGGASGGVTLEADTNYLQQRVSDTCSAGQSIRIINSDGSVVCQPDNDTTYSVGAGLSLLTTQFSLSDGGVTTNKLADNNVTGTKLANGAVTDSKIADDSVNDRQLNLSTSEIYLGSNTPITSTVVSGQTLLSFSDLAPGTYVIYGLAQGYVDEATDTHGGILFSVNDGTIVLRAGPSFYFTEATGWQEGQGSGFMFVITLSETTTLNLAAHKGPGNLTAAVAGGGTYFGYIKVGS